MISKSAITVLALVLCFIGAHAGRMFILDDGDYNEQIRYRRDLSEEDLNDIQASGSAAAPIYRRQGQAQDKNGYEPPSLQYNPIPPVSDLDTQASSHGYKKKGIVGPVYTFVKTDEYAHVKWGVRHVAGKKYAGHHRK